GRSDQSVLSPGQDHGAAKSHLRGQSDCQFRTRDGLQSRQGARRRHDLGTETIVSVSGGTKDLRYFASGSVKNDPGIIDNTGYQKQAVRLNLGKDLGDLVTLNFYSNLIHSNAKRGITNNDNTNTSNWIVLSGTPSYVNLNPQGGIYPTNPYSPNLNNPLQTVALMNNDEGVWRATASADSTFRILDTEEQRLRFIVTG